MNESLYPVPRKLNNVRRKDFLMSHLSDLGHYLHLLAISDDLIPFHVRYISHVPASGEVASTCLVYFFIFQEEISFHGTMILLFFRIHFLLESFRLEFLLWNGSS